MLRRPLRGGLAAALVWYGPDGTEPFSEKYEADEARAWEPPGQRVAPKNLLVKSGGSVARLERGPTRGGRANRHGYVYRF